MRYRKSVFIVVYAKTNVEVRYLLLQRRLHWRGWEFPKGGIEKNEIEKNAAKREVFEETGLKPLSLKRFNFSGSYRYKKNLSDRFGFDGQEFYLYSAQVKQGKVKIDKREHIGFKWTGFFKAYKMLKFPNQKKSLKIVNDWLKTTVQAWPVRRKIS